MNARISFALLFAALLVGCATRSVLTTEQRDRLVFAANQPERIDFRHVPLPIDLPRFVDPDAEVIAPSPVPLPATTNRVTLRWHQPGTCYGTRVERSTNLITWEGIGFVFNEYIRHDSEESLTFTNTFNPVFFRVAAFNP